MENSGCNLDYLITILSFSDKIATKLFFYDKKQTWGVSKFPMSLWKHQTPVNNFERNIIDIP